MTKSTNKTIWALGLVGVVVFLAWKLWPAIRNKLNSSGSSGGGAIGATTAGSQYPYDPYGNQQQPNNPALSGNLNLPGSNSGGGTGNAFSDWLNSVLNQGYQNASQLGDAGDLEASDASDLGGLDSQGLPLETVDYGDQDQYLITQDVPGSDSSDYYPQTISVDAGDIPDEGSDNLNTY